MKQTKKDKITLDDYIKAVKKGNREAEQELLGPGFHATHRIHSSKKTYTRKRKHKGWEE
ncbi:hypothetical protein [Bacteroides gallinarum]|jgi:hypothetical protein|uniref:hypothetical protein n=1 Tax=Bacteroides gallinarum TaxID=376806 RepID=UPI00035D1B1D|nr:hypothetical protein [Bacteroides gallinarum]